MIETKKEEEEEYHTHDIVCCMLFCVLLNRHEYSIAWDCFKVVLFGFMYFNIDRPNADGLY